MYIELYRLTFMDLENRWDKAVQRKPREGETAEDVAAGQREEDGDEVLQVEIELDLGWGARGDEAAAPAPVVQVIPTMFIEHPHVTSLTQILARRASTGRSPKCSR
jgi:hypothetical protein